MSRHRSETISPRQEFNPGKETEAPVLTSLSFVTGRALRGTAFAVGATGMVLMSVLPLAAQTPDASDIAEGARLFRQKGNCQSCHGWAGDGRKMDSQMPDGANLRETRLDRAALIMTIKCGIPGTGMPPFDKFAYSDGRCYGLKQADLAKAGQRMSDPPATLQNREIEFLADFMFAKMIGKGPMNHAKCIEFWGEETETCGEFPK
jgi:mono/diheme cytochrome c family protein